MTGKAASHIMALRQPKLEISQVPTWGKKIPPRLVPTSAIPMAVPRFSTNQCDTSMMATINPLLTSTREKRQWMAYMWVMDWILE